MDRNIYLVGFMGAGKSHVGKKLATKLYCPFVDLDTMIERAAQMSINDIFATRGEAFFRLLERRVLHDTAFGPRRIVATGGGAPCFFNNMEWINAHGLAIYLDAQPMVLQERLWRGRAKRPLLHGMDKTMLLRFIQEKIEARDLFYRQAPVRYRIENPQQDAAGDLLRNLDQITGH